MADPVVVFFSLLFFAPSPQSERLEYSVEQTTFQAVPLSISFQGKSSANHRHIITTILISYTLRFSLY